MILGGSFIGSQRGSSEADLTCYTSPVTHVTYSWPSQMGAYASALYLFSCIFLAVVVVWMWAHYRPCETCGEYRVGCRCKGRAY